jgi:hypothetical protein
MHFVLIASFKVQSFLTDALIAGLLITTYLKMEN